MNYPTYISFSYKIFFDNKNYLVDLISKLIETNENINLEIRIINIIKKYQTNAPIKLINNKQKIFGFEIYDNYIILKHCCNEKFIPLIEKSIKNKIKNLKVTISKINIINELKLTKEYEELIKIENIINGPEITTITIYFKTNTNFNFLNIGQHLTINKYKDVELITYGLNGKTYRRTFKNLKPKKKKKNNFYNQVSLKVNINSKNKPLNIKLFNKKSIQITGYKKISDLIEIIILINTLCKEEKYLYENSEFKKIIFSENIDEFLPEKIFNIEIAMINSNYKLGFYVSSSKLYECLNNSKNNNINLYISHEKNIHTSVDIKYKMKNRINNKNEYVSIFIFESGSVIITGSKTADELIEVFCYLIKFIEINYQNIIKIIDF